MVAISKQYPIGADKVVQISRPVVFDKGTQPEYSTQNREMVILIRMSDLLYAWLFKVQTC